MSTRALLVGSELKQYDHTYYEDVPCEGGCGEEATCTVIEREGLSAGSDGSEIVSTEIDYCKVCGSVACAEASQQG